VIILFCSIWNEAVVACFDVLSLNVSLNTKYTMRNLSRCTWYADRDSNQVLPAQYKPEALPYDFHITHANLTYFLQGAVHKFL
jgi:hypothetical protein